MVIFGASEYYRVQGTGSDHEYPNTNKLIKQRATHIHFVGGPGRQALTWNRLNRAFASSWHTLFVTLARSELTQNALQGWAFRRIQPKQLLRDLLLVSNRATSRNSKHTTKNNPRFKTEQQAFVRPKCLLQHTQRKNKSHFENDFQENRPILLWQTEIQFRNEKSIKILDLFTFFKIILKSEKNKLYICPVEQQENWSRTTKKRP